MQQRKLFVSKVQGIYFCSPPPKKLVQDPMLTGPEDIKGFCTLTSYGGGGRKKNALCKVHYTSLLQPGTHGAAEETVCEQGTRYTALHSCSLEHKVQQRKLIVNKVQGTLHFNLSAWNTRCSRGNCLLARYKVHYTSLLQP